MHITHRPGTVPVQYPVQCTFFVFNSKQVPRSVVALLMIGPAPVPAGPSHFRSREGGRAPPPPPPPPPHPPAPPHHRGGEGGGPPPPPPPPRHDPGTGHGPERTQVRFISRTRLPRIPLPPCHLHLFLARPLRTHVHPCPQHWFLCRIIWFRIAREISPETSKRHKCLAEPGCLRLSLQSKLSGQAVSGITAALFELNSLCC